jgi:hypothetical protein
MVSDNIIPCLKLQDLYVTLLRKGSSQRLIELPIFMKPSWIRQWVSIQLPSQEAEEELV